MPITATMSDAYSALRLRRPVETAVTPTAMPSARNAYTTMPMLGSANHSVTDRYVSTAPVATAEMPNTMNRRRHRPPRSDIQMRPATIETPMITGTEIVGSPSQLFSWMAPYCFSRTATQKIGSEKKRNDISVTP
jgi:hypothetical protein